MKRGKRILKKYNKDFTSSEFRGHPSLIIYKAKEFDLLLAYSCLEKHELTGQTLGVDSFIEIMKLFLDR